MSVRRKIVVAAAVPEPDRFWGAERSEYMNTDEIKKIRIILTRVIFFFSKAKNSSIVPKLRDFFFNVDKEKKDKTKTRKAIWFGYLLGLMFLLPQFTEAQCSMCRAVTNSNQLADDAFAIGSGLNNGIMYMMMMPYLFGAIFIYAFFGKQIRGWVRKKLS